jgi:sugar/nucleoside kinase (ribokinase family)
VRLSRARLSDILRYANAVGALTSLKAGVIPALPTAPEVKDFLARYA